MAQKTKKRVKCKNTGVNARGRNYDITKQMLYPEGVVKTAELEATLGKFSSAIWDGRLKDIEITLGSHLKKIALTARDPFGRNALMIASELGNTEVVKALVQAGADVNARKIDKLYGTADSTSLMLACAAGHAGTVEALIEAGADVNAERRDGLTSLMLAARHNQVDVVKTLLKNGANRYAKTQFGLTALDYAKQNCNDDLVKLIVHAPMVDPKPRSIRVMDVLKGIAIVLCSVGGFFLMLAISLHVYDSIRINRIAKSTPAPYHAHKTEAYGYATTYVRAALKSPSSARFSSYTDPFVTIQQSGNVFTVTGWVDAQNSFGAILRKMWKVKLESNGQGAWRPLSVVIYEQ